MVERFSSLLFLPTEHRVPVAGDHSGIAKLHHRADSTYQAVVTRIQEVLETNSEPAHRLAHLVTSKGANDFQIRPAKRGSIKHMQKQIYHRLIGNSKGEYHNSNNLNGYFSNSRQRISC